MPEITSFGHPDPQVRASAGTQRASVAKGSVNERCEVGRIYGASLSLCCLVTSLVFFVNAASLPDVLVPPLAPAYSWPPITQAEANESLAQWFSDFENLNQAELVARFVETHYAFDVAETLFKPTTANPTIVESGAKAYFGSQIALISAFAPSVSYSVHAVIGDPFGQTFVYGQFTLHLAQSNVATAADILDSQFNIKMNAADNQSVTFDFSMGLTRTSTLVTRAIKIFLHHNVWLSTPSRETPPSYPSVDIPNSGLPPPMSALDNADVDRVMEDWFAQFQALNSTEAVVDFVDRFYAFDHRPTFFKPTTKNVNVTKAAAIDYFQSQTPLILGTRPSISHTVRERILDRFGQAFVYGDFTMELNFASQDFEDAVQGLLEVEKIEMNPDGRSVTFDFTFGFTRTDRGIQMFVHHNVWRSTPM